MGWIKDWFTDSWKLTEWARSRSGKIAFAVFAAVMVLVFVALMAAGTRHVDSDGLLWAVVNRARLDILKAVGDLGRFPLAILATFAAYAAIDNSGFGQRLMVIQPNELDKPEIVGSKIRNDALVFCAILLVAGLIFGNGGGK